MKPYIQQWDFSIRLVVSVAGIGLLNCLFLPWQTTIELMQENGLIENLTVLKYYLATLVVWLFWPRSLPRATAWASTFVLLGAAMRELDLHKSMYGTSILKSSFYLRDATPAQIVVALLMLLPAIFALAYLVIVHGKELVRAIRQKNPPAITIATLFVTTVFAKIVDRSLNVLVESLGWVSPAWMHAVQLSFEEPLELVLPLLVVLAIAQANMAAAGRRE